MGERAQMNRKTLLIFSLALIGACTLCAESPEGNLDKYPMNVFIGMSAPYSNADKMLNEALSRCARSDAISENIYVTAKLIAESTNATPRSTATDGNALFVADDIESIAGRLKVLAVLTRPEGTIVIAMDPLKGAESRPYAQQFDTSGTPTWVDNPPEIKGYTVAVGETLAHEYVRDSLEAADISAAYSLLNKSANAVTDARSYSVNKESSGASMDLRSPSGSLDHGTMQISKGILTGFTVLAHWRDPVASKFYSLAVVPESTPPEQSPGM